MTYPSDDESQMFVPPNIENPPRYAVGILEEWDSATFTNAVRYRGALLRNLAVINGLEALGFTPGIQVSLLGHSGTGAMVSFAILGRYVQPGATATTEAIQSLQSTVVNELLDELVTAIVPGIISSPEGAALVKFIIGSAIHAADVTATVTTTSSTFVSLSGGPSVSGVQVSDTRKMIVMVGSKMNVSNNHAGSMSFDVSGASSITPTDLRAHVLDYNDPDVGGVNEKAVAATVLTASEGLNAGTHTVAARYRRRLGLANNISFSDRTLIVIAF